MTAPSATPSAPANGKGRPRVTVKGTELLARVKEIVHNGNVRRIVIKGEDGRPIIEMPLTVGAAGAVLIPMWVAVGAIAALAANYTIEVEKEDEPAG
ncbi:MAG: DUF4342 domain-containing protein [Gemmatimonadota bacterium]|nr:DUF4342 domain-containing protein [Gemmatimonadota bacterium]